MRGERVDGTRRRCATHLHERVRLQRAPHALHRGVDTITNLDQVVVKEGVLRAVDLLPLLYVVGGVAALRVPQEGIVDYAAVCRALVRRLLDA